MTINLYTNSRLDNQTEAERRITEIVNAMPGKRVSKAAVTESIIETVLSQLDNTGVIDFITPKQPGGAADANATTPKLESESS